MELPSAQELREHYRRLSTDELIDIRVSGDLTVLARGLIEEELSRRGVTEEDIAQAYPIEVPEEPAPVCPHCGADGTKKSAPGDEWVLSTFVLPTFIFMLVLFLIVELFPNRWLRWLAWATFLALINLAAPLFRGGPKRYQCAECGYQFLYPSVYRDDLPSESVFKQQRSRASLKTDSPPAQTKK